MDDKLFKELVESVEQAGAIRRGEVELSRNQTYKASEVKTTSVSIGCSPNNKVDES